MEKELTKKLLRNETCDNCRGMLVTREGDLRWCIMKSIKPKENTCSVWTKKETVEAKPSGFRYVRK